MLSSKDFTYDNLIARTKEALANKPVKHYDTVEQFYNYLTCVLGSETLSEQELNDLNETYLTIILNGHEVTIPFSADVFNSLVSLVEQVNK